MSNWDLMMPGMGLTAIGLAGVTISYAGIAHTFIDGMHALTGLTMFIGLIFLAAGILEGGVSTSNRAKATTLVVLGISFSFGLAALNFNTISTIPTFAGVMLIVVVPAIVMAYVAMKMPQYAKPVSIIFIIAVGAAVAAYVGFGLFGPAPYLVPPPVVEEEVEEPAPTAPIFAISILKGSATQGNPDYEPDVAEVPLGNIIEWTNNDDVAHTVTSVADGGATFDSSLIAAGTTYRLDTSTLQAGTYDYFCVVHPWMAASFVLAEGGAAKAPVFNISILLDSQIQGNPDYDPDVAEVPLGAAITWTNNDSAVHTVTSAADAGATFDSGLISAGATYQLDTSKLGVGKYDYMCIVHPWMQASFEIVESGERLAGGATVTEPSSPPETPEESEETVTEMPVPGESPVEESIVEEPVIEEPVVEEPITEPVQQSNTISIPLGVSTPGCEATNECFAPSSLTVPVGTTVTWTNDDTAAHTITSGSDATPDGNFDSGLFMAGKTFSHTFDSADEYPYYCLVHPWMTGKVTVE
ncbi:MAG TPA: plastocyanin/azurin family copper-binding protein [Candidatus Nitrosotenuis sp.]|nr:plastocyanin/azurin family copper-binding protein [Candidatus Nitrosotenuis sp.]